MAMQTRREEALYGDDHHVIRISKKKQAVGCEPEPPDMLESHNG